MFARRAKVLWVLLILSELILVAFAFELSYFARAIAPEFREFYLSSGTFAGLLLAAACLWAVIGLALGLYTRRDKFDPLATAGETIKQSVWFGLFIFASIYLLKLGEVSRLFVGLFIFCNFAVQLVYRLAAHRMRGFLRSGISQPQNYLIVGTGAKAMEVLRGVEKHAESG